MIFDEVCVPLPEIEYPKLLMCWEKPGWKAKQFLVRKRSLLDRISDQNLPLRNRQIIAGASYERRETRIQVSVLPDLEQKPLPA